MEKDNNKMAFEAGADFAKYLNDTPREAQNWGFLTERDEMPSEDYVTLRESAGVVTDEMADEYRRGFNSVFEPVN